MPLKQLQQLVRQHNLAALLIHNSSATHQDPAMLYATGTAWEHAFLLITPRRARLFVPGFEVERAQKKGVQVTGFQKTGLSVLAPWLIRYAKKGPLGFNPGSLPVSLFSRLRHHCPGCQWKNMEKPLREVRRIKTAKELDAIHKACMLTTTIFGKLVDHAKKRMFRSEQDIERFLQYQAIAHGAELAFAPIVASGKRAALPHATPTPFLGKGFIVLDFGIRYQGYCSDMTRMLYKGKPTQQDKARYEHLCQVQKKTLNFIQQNGPGTKTACIDAFARKAMGAQQSLFTHGLGHGVGIQVHEKPVLNTTSKDRLHQGDVFTVEPGMYFPDRSGLRIEDTVVLRKGGVDVLTSAPKTLVVVP